MTPRSIFRRHDIQSKQQDHGLQRHMLITTLLLFAVTEFFLSLSPGPAGLLVISQGVRSGARSSLLGTIGILTGNVIYFSMSAMGLGVILITSEMLFLLIKYMGAIYLGYLGAKMIIQSLLGHESNQAALMPASRQKLFREGLLTQLGNPKAIVFFAALLPQFIDAHQATVSQFIILGIISVLIEYPILMTYGWLADKGSTWFRHGKYAVWIDRAAGTFLIGAGIKLAFMQKN
jgi:homoserine/homoserine lactone efflux protein